MQREAGETALGGAIDFDGQGVVLPRGIAQRSVLRRGWVWFGGPGSLGILRSQQAEWSVWPGRPRGGERGARISGRDKKRSGAVAQEKYQGSLFGGERQSAMF